MAQETPIHPLSSILHRRRMRLRTDLPQVRERINPRVMLVGELEPQGVTADKLRVRRGQRPFAGFRKHRQLRLRFARLFLAKCFAGRTGAMFPQIRQRINTRVPVLPLNFQVLITLKVESKRCNPGVHQVDLRSHRLSMKEKIRQRRYQKRDDQNRHRFNRLCAPPAKRTADFPLLAIEQAIGPRGSPIVVHALPI